MSVLSEEKIKEIAEKMPQGFMWSEGCNWESGILIQEAIDFARAIETAVLEAQKQEPFPFSAERVTYHKTEAIGTIMPCGTMVTNVKEAYEAGKKQSFAHPFNPSLQVNQL